MSDYRIVQYDDLFAPQKKGLLWGWNFIEDYSAIDGCPGIVMFFNRRAAQDWIDRAERGWVVV